MRPLTDSQTSSRPHRSLAIASTFFILTTAASFGQLSIQRPNKVHNPNRTEALTIIVRPSGFGESEIRVPAGRYSLSVFNRSGIDDLPIVLERMAGERSPTVEQALRNDRADVRLSRFVDRRMLTKGSYRVRIPTHPKWVLKIEVN